MDAGAGQQARAVSDRDLGHYDECPDRCPELELSAGHELRSLGVSDVDGLHRLRRERVVALCLGGAGCGTGEGHSEQR